MDPIRDGIDEGQLAVIRARLDEPPPMLALASRNNGLTAISAYLTLLREDRIQLLDEIDRLRAEMEDPGGQDDQPTN
jgi:hypothetical protein